MSTRVRAALGIALLLLGGVVLATELGFLEGWEASVWTLVWGAVGVLFLILAVTGGRDNWWAIIPALFSLTLAAFLYVTERELLVEEVAVGGFLFFGLALPFWLVLLVRGRTFWWAAIPGGVMTFIALSILLAPANEALVGSLVMWAIAVPFWIVYFLDRERWWALIPAGTMTVTGALPLVAEVWPPTLVAALIMGGLALTFLLVYLLNRSRGGFAWALWPAAILLVFAVAVPLLGEWSNLIWPVGMIAGGLLILLLALRRR
jgi:hypothetical protein